MKITYNEANDMLHIALVAAEYDDQDVVTEGVALPGGLNGNVLITHNGAGWIISLTLLGASRVFFHSTMAAIRHTATPTS